ncbi:unnamed protein product [Soboliphyme baturini]|uniref:GOLD domain-containing protein n=1 Tax=Soboliphyme baturini TaxID=241478 RepID=A0A183J667_9BILA|nr:unnamed protein product [Soboliphyme baturini]
MAQVYSQQMSREAVECGGRSAVNAKLVNDVDETSSADGDSDSANSTDHDELPSNPAVALASMWTRKDIKEFKDAVRKEGIEGVIKVGHGETVTVRVPTHQDGTCLFWEFATDNYDIGFGLFFEWTVCDTNVVSVHVSESDDDDDEACKSKVSIMNVYHLLSGTTGNVTVRMYHITEYVLLS